MALIVLPPVGTASILNSAGFRAGPVVSWHPESRAPGQGQCPIRPLKCDRTLGFERGCRSAQRFDVRRPGRIDIGDNVDRPAADFAVLDVLLVIDRAIDQQFDRLTAIRTLDRY